MKLIPVARYIGAVHVLWKLLAQRDLSQNISHREMPTWEAHCLFVLGHPYQSWDIIEVDERAIGAIYLSKPGGPSVPGNEIGIDLFPDYRHKGLGKQAVQMLMERHGNLRYTANTAPANEASQALFKSLGFKLAQFTYVLEAA